MGKLDNGHRIGRGRANISSTLCRIAPRRQIGGVVFLQTRKSVLENGGDGILVTHTDEGGEDTDRDRKDLVILVVVAAVR